MDTNLPQESSPMESSDSSSSQKKTKIHRKRPWLVRQIRFFFALILCAILFRWLLLEAYTIPSVSMAGTLQPGDFILVSKLHYGPRTPSTLLHLPLTHRKIWGTDYNAYLDIPQIRLPSYRLATWDVQHNDVVVFNYPLDSFPTELKTPYVKRCVGLPGDTLEIKQSKIYANQRLLPITYPQQFRYFISTSHGINPKFFEKVGISEYSRHRKDTGYIYVLQATPLQVRLLSPLQEVGMIKGIIRQESKAGQHDPALFPKDESLAWNPDFYGPVLVPRQGLRMPMSPQNVKLYGRLIKTFESGKNRQISLKDEQLLLNGKVQKQYTFRKDYYFMMGDNFHASLDSRYWGFVPADHLIGKAVMVWMSLDTEKPWFSGKIRWSRMGWVD